MGRFDVLYNEVNKLNEYELKSIAEKVFQLLKQTKSFNTTEQETKEAVNCRKCGSSEIKKYGRDINGKQRYKCKSCGCTFTKTSFSAYAHSHCSEDTWKKYIRLLLLRRPLMCCAEECNISVRTAFLWRHKILSLLQHDQDNRTMNGIVEVDDTFFSVSYKGNHKKSTRFVMPRKAFKRGSDNKSMSGRKACVFCVVERKGNVYAEVLGIGSASEKMLDYALKSRLLNDTIVVADKAHSIKKYFSNTEIELIQTQAHVVPRDPSSPPEIKGVYHLQNVNNLHKRFRQFMKNYSGVATKYLNHYLNLFIWFENHKVNSNADFENEFYSYISSHGSYRRSKDIIELPPIPSVA